MQFRRALASIALFAFPCCALAQSPPQESSSRKDATPPPSPPLSGPAGALRDALGAACSHDELSFRKFLTARNVEAFSHMTAASRNELLKRFVLLDNPGTPAYSTDDTNRVLIQCQTQIGTASIRIASPTIHDNIAFLPVDISDASETDLSRAQHVQMTMIRDDGQWKLLSVGLLFLDLPSLAAEWDRAQSAQNEDAALDNLKALEEAIEGYRRTYTHLPESLAQLGPPAKGDPTASAAGLIDADMADGEKNGYAFRFVILGASDVGAPAKYELSATPKPYGRAGKNSFFRDSSGVYHVGDHLGAVGSDLDPKVK